MSAKKDFQKKEFVEQDLNRRILRNERSKRFARQFFFSRTVLTLIALALQLGLLLFFLINLSNRIEVYLSSSVFLSIGFMIYIANNKSKNEYKIAWIAPVAIFPIVGITCYFLYHIDSGAKKLKKQIKQINADMSVYLPKKADAGRSSKRNRTADQRFLIHSNLHAAISFLNSHLSMFIIAKSVAKCNHL